MEGAETVKVAVDAFAGTVTDRGTVRGLLLSDRAMMVPPAGAVRFNVTVQVEVPGTLRGLGLQVSEVILGAGAATVITPPTLLIWMPLPAAEAATVSASPIELVTAVADRVMLATATTPFGITLVFSPVSR